MVDYGAPSIGQDTAMARPSRHPTAPATLSLGLGHRRLLVSKTSPHWLDLAAARFPKEKVFQDKLPFACGERRVADPARYFQIDSLRVRWRFDNLVESKAAFAAEQRF
jgi:hypothetical protein